MQLLEVQYLPCVSYLKAFISATYVALEYCENFQKMSFRNRCYIAGSNNEIELSIPLLFGREQHSPIRQVQIDYSGGWNRQHWKSLQSAYARSPYFEYYGPQIRELLMLEVPNLFDFNILILKWILTTLKFDGEVFYTSSFKALYGGAIVDNRNRWLPKNFRDVPDAEVTRYTQVFQEKHGFRKNLSIIDLLFCEGPNAAALLKANV